MGQPAIRNAEPRVLRATPRYFQRIDLFHRLVHGFLMASFLGLAATGMPIKFNAAPWAATVAHAMGGFGTIIFFHKTFAAILTLCFLLHLGYVAHAAFVKGEPGIFWGPYSMVPQPKDILDMFRNFQWFFGLGPKPRFDRFTYWEKFDYWAVFWGMGIIGGSGYVMWASGFFARFVPGWMFNIALLIHSEEALLAVWFIFAVHFFNSHLRPEKFPMDLVIFTGRVSEQELHEERPIEMERLLAHGGLDAIETSPPPLWLRNFGRIIGFTVIAMGFTLFILTLFAF
jgi:cytochrome b subunit of formate dehydrogenase